MDYPTFDDFKNALRDEFEPGNRAQIERYNSRFRHELHAANASLRNGIPIRGSLLLTTTGAKSGRLRTNPLSYVRDGAHFLLVASAGGRDRNPAWYHNIRATPSVSVEVAGMAGVSLEAIAVDVTEPAERERLIDVTIRIRPVYAEFWPRSRITMTRTVPIVTIQTYRTDLRFDDRMN